MAGVQGNQLWGAVKRGARNRSIIVRKNRQVNFGSGLSLCHDFQKIGGKGFGFSFHPFESGSGGGQIVDPLLRRAFGRRAGDAAQRFRDEPS